MKKVIVPKPQSDSLMHQLASLYKTFKDVPTGESLNFDLQELAFASPLIILPICAHINTSQGGFEHGDKNEQIKSYLDTIKFPNGVNSVSEFEKEIQKTKNYIPISVLMRSEPTGREKLESQFEEMIYKTINKTDIAGIQNAIYQPICEFITNIFEHSKEDKGFVFGQFYPKIGMLDICIVDCGRGLRATYKEEKNLTLSDENAISETMKGNSTKPGKDRGYGVRTSRRIVCEALGGQFVLVSNSAALISNNTEKEKLVALPNFNWQGVIVAYRIPVPNKPVDITPYLE